MFIEMIKDIIDFNKVKKLILYILICVLLCLVSAARQSHKDRLKYEAQMENLRIELTEKYESEIFEIRRDYELGNETPEMHKEAEYICKVIYGTARNHSIDGQKAVVWCILNRVEHPSYPNSIEEVCEQSQQWMGYSYDNPVLNDTFEMVLEELKSWYDNGHRPMSKDYIYLSWSSNEIVLRDTFEEKSTTHYWRVK